MRGLKIFPLIALLPWTSGQFESPPPACALRCWENTQYVSQCAGELACLCSDTDYQKSMYQCLYSQCDTARFGSALHHITSQCSNTGNQILFAAPPIPNRELLRRREAEYVAGDLHLVGSGSAAGYPTESAGGFPTQSAFLTPSASFPMQNAPQMQSVTGQASSGVASSSVPYFPLNTATSSAVTSATQTSAEYKALPASTTTTPPQLYTGLGSSTMPTISLALLIISMVVLLNS